MKKNTRLNSIFIRILLTFISVLSAQETLDIDLKQNKEIEALKYKIAELESIIESLERPTDDFETEKRMNRRKFADLEEKLVQLQNQIKELHSVQNSRSQNSRSQNSKINISEDWRNQSNWRKLEKNMSPSQVLTLLGQPKKVDSGYITYWIYVETSSGIKKAYVSFSDGIVTGWLEPNF